MNNISCLRGQISLSTLYILLQVYQVYQTQTDLCAAAACFIFSYFHAYWYHTNADGGAHKHKNKPSTGGVPSRGEAVIAVKYVRGEMLEV